MSMSSSKKEEFSRLPANVIPLNYEITLHPDLDKLTFDGSVKIAVKVIAASPTIELNAADLVLGNVIWKEDNSQKVQSAASVALNNEKEILTLQFDPPINPGKGTLELSFDGILNDKLKGFYRSKYKGPNGEERYNAVTQLAPTDARRCFPCWDEPAIKATFEVNLIVSKDKVALSNMSVKEIKPLNTDANLQVVSYDKSPIMSTYLVAIVVGEFDYVEAPSIDGSVVCRVYTPVGKKDQGRFALDVCTKVLPYYNEYFGIPYPLPKLDLIAVADFSYGAMENWGLITYRETCLLIDDQESSATSRQWVALVVGHEVAHQWFGNLVTMEWWDGLFLNEGYATFVEHMCVHHLFPSYDIWTQFVTNIHTKALGLDSLKNSHPVEVPVGHPSEINEIFDAISYHKGATVIRMLHQFIGDEYFRKGMNLYLTRHQYNNAKTEDLWKALGEASGKPVADVMSTWTQQMGFPILKVTSQQEGNNRVLNITQKKFWGDPRIQEPSASNGYKWMIPLTFSTDRDPEKIIAEKLMSSTNVTVTIPNVDPDAWVKVNPGNVGYYRVRYTPEILKQFLPAICNTTMPPQDRLGLLDDLFAMVQCGEGSAVDVMKLLEAFKNENNYTVWTAIDQVVAKLSLLMAYTPHYTLFKAHCLKIFSTIANSVGWECREGEDHLQSLLRSLVLSRMASLHHVGTINEASCRFQAHISGEKIIPADLRSAVYAAVLSTGMQDIHDRILKMYCGEAGSMEEKDRIAKSLGASGDPGILTKVLQFSISENVRLQDTVVVVASVGKFSTIGRELAWNFFKDNWKLFHDRYAGGLMVACLVKCVLGDFVSEDKAVEVREFFANHPFPGTERTVEQAIESILINDVWMKGDQLVFQEFLTSQ